MITMDSASGIFYSCFIFSWIVFFWEFYLSLRQYRKYRDTVEVPDDLRGVTDEEVFRKSRLYMLDRSYFGFAANTWQQIENSIVLLFGLIPTFWHISGHIITTWNLSHEIWQSLVFLLLVTLVSKITNLPWSLYSTFVIEERHGFNKQTLGFFIKDEIKGLLLGIVIGAPILAGVIWIIQKGGDYFFVILWCFLTVIIFVMMTIYPEFIAPLFDKYTPLPEGELRTKIEALAAKLAFPLKKLFVVEGSKRSAHSNAYLYGLWKNKRIVLYDTLLANYSPLNEDKTDENKTDKDGGGAGEKAPEQKDGDKGEKVEQKGAERKSLGMTDDEVVAVLGHELGHWKLNHTLLNIVVSEVQLFCSLALFAFLYKTPSVYAAFGFPDKHPTLIGLVIIFQFLFAPVNEVLNFLMTAWTRRKEFQADAFSGELGYSKLLQTGLRKMEKDNLMFPVDDWLYSMWHHDHPPVRERVAALKKYD